jgi:hypothetical protein
MRCEQSRRPRFKCGTKRGRNPLKTLGGAGKNAAKCTNRLKRAPTPRRFRAQRGRLHPTPELGALRGKRSSRRMSRSTSPTKKETRNCRLFAPIYTESSCGRPGRTGKQRPAGRPSLGAERRPMGSSQAQTPKPALAIIRPDARDRRQCDLRHCAGSSLRLKV